MSNIINLDNKTPEKNPGQNNKNNEKREEFSQGDKKELTGRLISIYEPEYPIINMASEYREAQHRIQVLIHKLEYTDVVKQQQIIKDIYNDLCAGIGPNTEEQKKKVRKIMEPLQNLPSYYLCFRSSSKDESVYHLITLAVLAACFLAVWTLYIFCGW